MGDKTIKEFIDVVIPFVTTYGLRVLGALLILLAGRIASRICGKLTVKALHKAKTAEELVGFLSSLVRYSVLAFAIVAALNQFGVQTTSFVAVLGAAGLAVGLALQGSLSNFAAGVLILLFRPFKLGDFIEAGGAMGNVVEISILYTILNSPDNKKLTVPNSTLTTSTITNYTGNPTRRIDLIASIAYDDDMDVAREVMHKLITSHPAVLKEPEPVVEVHTLNSSSVDLVVRPWVKTDDYWPTYWDLTRKMKEELEKAGLTIPFPQRDVHLYQQAPAAKA